MVKCQHISRLIKSWGMGAERKGRRLIVLDKEIGMDFTAGEGFRARKNLFIPKEHGILKTLGFISSTRPEWNETLSTLQ